MSVQEIAAEVIRRTNREKPADAALREVLRRQRNLPPFDAAEVSHIVFRHYRWHGWLRQERNLEGKLRLAQRLEDRFKANPDSIPLADLRARAVPAWLLDEMEINEAWLRALQREPKLWLRAKRGPERSLAGKLGLIETPGMSGAFIYEGEADLFKSPEFHAGEFEIQDIASQAVGLLCDPKPGETWWDACAGEGGKLLHLSDLMQNKGLIWASDRAAWRLQKLKRRAARAKVFNYRAELWEGGAKLPTKTKFDGVLVDAPCSGIGTWQRNPHARWTTDVKDVLELAEVQKRLLANVAGSVKPGGKLVYSVCTLTGKETVEVVEEFSRTHVDFESMTLPVELVSRTPTSAATVTIGPQDLGGNGMFIAGWRRRK
ncbi:MAG TPA: RsmB/NOP family class I SAM-dependent RNA methyltransferase [Verrucomicrobiae bacterium]|nr:RsmB/NOP family class I SAM-dependent RNA methyltransferase [Verrucomicrobiae bacterium]